MTTCRPALELDSSATASYVRLVCDAHRDFCVEYVLPAGFDRNLVELILLAWTEHLRAPAK